MLRSVSYSRLLAFETCPYSAKLKHIDRIPEEKSEHAERGTHIHQLAEDFVAGRLSTLPPELAKFNAEYNALRSQYMNGRVSLEGEWGFDQDWSPTDYRSAWLRVKLDARLRLSLTHSVVVDYKTGKRFGNEVKHGEQIILYGLAECLREPKIKNVTVELWYLDVDDLVSTTLARETILRYLPNMEKRLQTVTSATEFPPQPSLFACKWCPYGPAKGGQCEHGVLQGDTVISLYRRKYG
ncbi:MAG: PD-(D/E)XK nuclease family protein [Azoarcus sp.]|jgi:RecB family exonuclease|nr:PD-(D/E)XK nuclease family protein [Azoarcus sp.]